MQWIEGVILTHDVITADLSYHEIWSPKVAGKMKPGRCETKFKKIICIYRSPLETQVHLSPTVKQYIDLQSPGFHNFREDLRERLACRPINAIRKNTAIN